MKYRGIFEYEYPTEHKPPVSIDVHLHGDCVKGKIIEWEYRPLEQEPILDKIRAEILDSAFSVVNPKNTYEYINVLDLDSIERILDKYKAETEIEDGNVD